MKKVVFIFLLSFIFLISCSNSSSLETGEQPDDQEEEQDISETPDNEQSDENTQEEQDEPSVVDEEIVPDNEPEQPEEEPNNPPQTDPIGNFNLNFSGQINTTISTSSRGGNGTVSFNYNENPYMFNEINVPMIGGIFPLAMLNSGNIIILWLDSFGVGDVMSAVEKQVFGISLPQNAEAGSGTMKNLGSYAFYGDISVNIQGGQFDVKCVRAVSDSGEYDITSNDGANITFTANGDLFDPALAGSMIPYPACE